MNGTNNNRDFGNPRRRGARDCVGEAMIRMYVMYKEARASSGMGAEAAASVAVTAAAAGAQSVYMVQFRASFRLQLAVVCVDLAVGGRDEALLQRLPCCAAAGSAAARSEIQQCRYGW